MSGSKEKKVKIYKKKRKNIPEENLIADLQARYETIDESKITKFSDLPLSPKTQKGLRENDYLELTDIQRQSIGLALRGNDILGAAKTGSGKTLAFLIPVLEILYCKRWTRLDGVGALVITPTRELAYQIYETLRKIGNHHDISAGLIIGGKDLQFEKKRMDQCNIIICTPGRLLQHMDENPLFDCVTMKVLVLDEADRCLDMGFETTMNAIIANLPPERQTLLFSATQTKSVRDLARLSLKNPLYVSVHENAEHTTPEGLQQSYVICNLEDKMAMLWSFIRHHLKQKVIVFFSSCKQVKYTYEVFCRMRPGVSLLALYGKLHQLKRMSIYETFCKKQNAVLLATDIAARGLDFPAVNWVVQMDCPEDTNAYIHRAGRTARFQRGGESLLVLLPSEEKIVEKLRERKIPISMIKINPNKFNSPHRKLEALLARDVALKETAQRAFVAYVKSVFLMKDKEIFNVHAFDTDSYAKSLGLAIPPRIRFLQRMQNNSAKDKPGRAKKEQSKSIGNESDVVLENMLQSTKSSGDDLDDNSFNDDSEDDQRVQVSSKETKNNIDNALFANDDSDDGDDILTVKRKNVQIEGDVSDEMDNEIADSRSKSKKAVTKAAMAKKILRKKIVPNKKTTFDEDGQELVDSAKSKVSELAKQYENDESSGINIEMAKKILREEDRFDKKRFQAKIKEKHREEKRKLKASKKVVASDDEDEDDEPETGVQLADYVSESEAEEPDISWLPDPDKIYGPKDSSDDEKSEHSDANEKSENSDDNDEKSENSDDNDEKSENADDNDEDIDEYVHRPPKRKLVTQEEFKKSKKKHKFEINESSDLQATEELALQLLRN